MFIWDFVASSVLNDIIDWIYSQVVGFLGNFFSEMGSMGAELFAMSWVQSIVLFFNYLAWALFVVGLVVAGFEFGIEYSSGRGDLKATALNIIKGFLSVSLFTTVPIRLYELTISLQSQLTAEITGYGTGSLADAALQALSNFDAVDSLTEYVTHSAIAGFGVVSSPIMVLFALFLMAYAVMKVFFANLKRGGILLIQIAVGSLYMFSIPRGYTEGFTQWCKEIINICLAAFLQSILLVAGLMVFRDHALLGLGLMLAAGELSNIARVSGMDSSAATNARNAANTARSAISLTSTAIRMVAR